MEKKVYINYIYDCCYSIEYGDIFLVFDYKTGIIDIAESKKVIFLVSSKDNYTPEIFNIPSLKSIAYVLNKEVADFKFDKNVIYLNKDKLGMTELKNLYKKKEARLISDEDLLSLDKGKLKIRSLAIGKNLCLIVDLKSLIIFYGANIDFNKISKKDYDNLKSAIKSLRPDILFLPINKSPCRSNHLVKNLISISKCQVFFPTNIGSKEEISLEFKKEFKVKGTIIMSVNKANDKILIDVEDF